MKRFAILILAAMLLAGCVKTPRCDVRPSELAEHVAKADRICVFESPLDDARLLYESTNRVDLASLRTALTVVGPKSWFHCMCSGAPAIRLYSGQHILGNITIHHARSIRCSIWSSDALLAEPETLVKWCDARNIPGPHTDVEATRKNERASAEAEQRWLHAMPSALRPLWQDMQEMSDPFGKKPDFGEMRAALAKQFPDKGDCIWALLAWYGSGAGPWSGYYAYEDIARNLLLDNGTSEILKVVEGRSLTGAQAEGLARLLAGFSGDRREDLQFVPAQLKQQMLNHCLSSDSDVNGQDIDRRERAQEAFGNKKAPATPPTVP